MTTFTNFLPVDAGTPIASWRATEKLMPFTVSHAVAGVLLHGALGRFGVLSALLIGCIVPDFEYFLPIKVSRHSSHSPLGLLYFCVPLGLVVYLVFHLLLKGPILSLMPGLVLSRLGNFTTRFMSLPRVPLATVILSLFCGAATHLLWDAFTHANAPGVVLLPFLSVNLFQIGNYAVYGYKILQHSSTILGLLLLTFWVWQWLRYAQVNPHPLPVALTGFQQAVVIGGVAGVSIVVALWAGTQTLGSKTGMQGVQVFASAAVFSGMSALGGCSLAYSLWWHLRRLTRPCDTPS